MICLPNFGGHRTVELIQRHAAADVGGDVQVFATMYGRFTLIEPALGNDFQRELALPKFGSGFADTSDSLALEELLQLFGRQGGRGGDESGTSANSPGTGN